MKSFKSESCALIWTSDPWCNRKHDLDWLVDSFETVLMKLTSWFRVWIVVDLWAFICSISMYGFKGKKFETHMWNTYKLYLCQDTTTDLLVDFKHPLHLGFLNAWYVLRNWLFHEQLERMIKDQLERERFFFIYLLVNTKLHICELNC